MTQMTDTNTGPVAEEQSTTGPHILQAIRTVMREVRGVPKAGEMMSSTAANARVQYRYQRYEDMAAAIGAAFRDHGVATQPKVVTVDYHRWDKPQQGGGSTLWTSCTMIKRFKFTSLVDGSALEVEACGEGASSSDKATNMATTSCLKNAYREAFTLAVTDEADPDSVRPEITEEVRNQPGQQQRAEVRQQMSRDPWAVVHQAAAALTVSADEPHAAAARKGFDALSRCRTTGDALHIAQWAAENRLLAVGVDGLSLAAHILAARGTLREGPPTQQRAHQTERPSTSEPTPEPPPEDGGY